MKNSYCLLLFLILSINNLFAQNETPSLTLPLSGTALDDFVPKGWVILKKATGDLNKDEQDDVAIVIQDQRQLPEGDDPMFTNLPRVLVVLLKTTEGYTRSAQHNSFILKATEGGTMGDPFSDLFIQRGVLNINFMGGSRELWSYFYKFRYQKKEWYLIGLDEHSYDRGNGDFEEWSYNYLTSKAKQVTGNEPNGTRESKWSQLEKKPLQKLNSITPL